MLRPHRRLHAFVWTMLALLLPLIIVAATALKRTRAPLPPNVQVSKPLPGVEAKP